MKKKNLEKIWNVIFYFFNIMVPYFHSNRTFSDKITILSCKTIFGPAFSVISENLVEHFFANFQKLWLWAKMAIFWHVWPKSAKMRFFIKNRAVLFFKPYCPPTSCEFQKNCWSGFRDQFVRSEHPKIRTKGEIIEPAAFAGSTSITYEYWTSTLWV